MNRDEQLFQGVFALENWLFDVSMSFFKKYSAKASPLFQRPHKPSLG